MSGGKGGSTTSTAEIPRWVQGPAERNLDRAEQAAQIGYVPHYGPSVAAFSPMQNQGFANIGAMGQAFGLAPTYEAEVPVEQDGVMGTERMPLQSQPRMFQPTMQPTDYGNGLQAYSSGPLYDLALEELRARRPDQFNAIEGMFDGQPAQQMQQQPQQQQLPDRLSGAQLVNPTDRTMAGQALRQRFWR